MNKLIVKQNKPILKIRLVLHDVHKNKHFIDINEDYKLSYHNAHCSFSWRNLQYTGDDIKWDLEEAIRSNNYQELVNIINNTIETLIDVKVMYK